MRTRSAPHRLEEMFEIGDKVTILRDGQYIDTKDVKDVTRGDIIKMMVGRELNNIYPEKKHKVTDKVVLEVKNLTGHKRFENISFKLHAGEILGLAGLMGAGRTEIARALFGLDPIHSGEVYLEGKKIAIKNTSDAMKHGIMMATEDRKRYGLVLKATIGENIGLPLSLIHIYRGPGVGLCPRKRRPGTPCRLFLRFSGYHGISGLWLRNPL